MKKYVSLLLTVLLTLGLFASCGKKTNENSTLKIGTENITGNFNPFYAESEGDKQVSAQIYPRIQYRSSSNKLVNLSGGISYEYIGESKVKYTVTIKNNLFFPDGTNVTIDDVIFWYYVLADATYDGPYSDFYLNDIEGLKEYYYDDADYETSLMSLTSDSSIKSYIKKNYADGISVDKISGINRVDDYTCTILFNSRNINAVSEINAYIVSKAFLTKEYVKGSADKIEYYTFEIPGCGGYMFEEYKSDKATLKRNPEYVSDNPGFKTCEFIDLEGKGKDAVDAVSSGYVDVVTTMATDEAVKSVSGENFKYYLTYEDSYSSLFINTKRVPSDILRKAIIGSTDVTSVLSEKAGGYSTKLYRPISIRFSEYPSDVNSDYYNSSSLTTYKLLVKESASISAYCIEDESGIDYEILSKLKETLASANITLDITACTEKELEKAIKSGKADIWIASVPDGETCDKYDYYNSNGKLNKTYISTAEIDELTSEIRRSTGFVDKSELTRELLELVMEQASELPLYQSRDITVYNTEIIDASSLENLNSYDGYMYVIPYLESNNKSE